MRPTSTTVAAVQGAILKLNIRSFSSWTYLQVEKELKLAIFRGTVDRESGEVDPLTLREISKIMTDRPEFKLKAVDMIKERIKDHAPSTSSMAMKLLDKIMQQDDAELRQYVAKKVLNRMLRLATPNMGTHPRVQSVSAALIKHWGLTYGSDEQLADFADFARCFLDACAQFHAQIDFTCTFQFVGSIGMTPHIPSAALALAASSWKWSSRRAAAKEEMGCVIWI